MPWYKANVKTGPWKVNDVFESKDERHEVLAAEGYLTKFERWPVPVDEPEPELELWPLADEASEGGEPEGVADVVDISEWGGT